MYNFQHFSDGDTPVPPFGAVTQDRGPSTPKSWLRAWSAMQLSSLYSSLNRPVLFVLFSRESNRLTDPQA